MHKKILYLARHAKSDWHDARLSDLQRPLNPRGKEDAPLIANILKARSVTPQLILSSPATRAKETAKIYHKTLNGSKEIELRFDKRIYEASSITLLFLIEEAFQEVDSLMVVGHNPALTTVNELLTNASIYNLVTASVVGIEFEEIVAANKGKQLFFEYPKKYTQ
ncbi:MAG: histidine phosphatase family protein [Sulfurovum sp.]|nr:histidine phosphatase family protein [Sulfurovum sp.]